MNSKQPEARKKKGRHVCNGAVILMLKMACILRVFRPMTTYWEGHLVVFCTTHESIGRYRFLFAEEWMLQMTVMERHIGKSHITHTKIQCL